VERGAARGDIAAGGNSEAGTSIGDSVVAFRLTREGEFVSIWSRTVDRPGGRLWASVITIALRLATMVWLLRRWLRASDR